MISICIPVRNAGAEFRDHLNRWKEQGCSEEFEIVVLDSGSEDGTVEIAKNLGVRVQTIPPTGFNHGESRNRLAEIARGDLLVFTVADAYPANGRTLVDLTQPLRQESDLVGVTGRQIPRPDADLMARWETDYQSQVFNKGVRRKRMLPPKEFARLDFNQQVEIISFDNVCSAMRRSAWERFPFSRLNFGEDLDWSFRVMKAGHAILHNPKAQVYHSHNRPSWIRFKRYFVTRCFLSHLLSISPATFPWSENEAFAALAEFRLEVENLRAKLRDWSGPAFLPKVRRSFIYLFIRALDKWGPEPGTVFPKFATPVSGGMVGPLL
jgi:rhamnosyltransferase